MHFLYHLFQPLFSVTTCSSLKTSNESDKTLFVISKNESLFSMSLAILHCFRTLSHLSSWILGIDNNRYPQSILLPFFEPLHLLLLPNIRLNDSQLLFKNKATVPTPSCHFRLLHMKNWERVTTPSTSTDCLTHLPCHLASQSTPLLKHNQHPLPLPALCVADMVIRLFNVFGMAQVSVLTVKKWDIQYTVAVSYDETSNVSILTYYIA